MNRGSFRWKTTLDVVTSLVMITAAAVIIWFQFNPRTAAGLARTVEPPKDPISIEGAALKGTAQANAVLIVYSDFQCPFCRRFARETLAELENEYISKGLLKLVFKHFPLPIHARAEAAAVAVECAGKQGRFWEMHDRVFEATSLDDATLSTLASSLGIVAPDFDACVQDKGVLAKVIRDRESGRSFGFASTPSFFLGRMLPTGAVKVERVLTGARPVGDFRAAIDALLK